MIAKAREYVCKWNQSRVSAWRQNVFGEKFFENILTARLIFTNVRSNGPAIIIHDGLPITFAVVGVAIDWCTKHIHCREQNRKKQQQNRRKLGIYLEINIR